MLELMVATDKGGYVHTAKFQDKPQGILRCQVHRFVCSCGWESEWKMNMLEPADDFREHMDLIDYGIENG